MSIKLSNWLIEDVDSSLVQTPVVIYVPTDAGIAPLAYDVYGTYTEYVDYGNYSNYSDYYNYYNYSNHADYYDYENYSDYYNYCDYYDDYYGDYYDYGNYYNYYNYSNYANSVTAGTSPSSKTVNEGATVSFSFSVSTGSSVTSKTYQWYYATSSTGSGTAISGATSTTYSVTGSAANHGRYYYCVCTTNGATKTVTSGRALLSVDIYRAYDIYVGVGSSMQIPTASNTGTRTITACTPANTSLISATANGYVTGLSVGTTTATVTIGGVSKTINVYVVENALVAAFHTIANTIRAKHHTTVAYYPNQFLNGFLSGSAFSTAYTTIEDLLTALSTSVQSEADPVDSVDISTLAALIASTISSF